jgi:hypothetical protein
MSDSFAGVYAWPHPAAGPSGTVALAYDHYQAAAYLALGDGLTFGAPKLVGSGVQGRVAFYGDGAVAATFQYGVNGGKIMNFVRIGDPASLAPAAPITSSNDNVHDSFPLARSDGDVDVYYIAGLAHGFSIFRRAVHRDGTMGDEEQVTAPDVGSCAQPHPKRFDDGSIAMTVACGNPGTGNTDVLLGILRNDAP